MAYITLDLMCARLVAGFGNSEISSDSRWRIILDAKPQWPTRLKLGTGEEIGWLAEPEQISMNVTFMEGDEGNIAWATKRTKDVGVDDWDKADAPVLGVMRFSPGSEGTRGDGFVGSGPTISFQIYTPREVLDSMVRFAESGRFITEVTFRVRGLNYDGRPDGTGKTWLDNDTLPILPVIGASYVLPLAGKVEDQPEPGAPKTLVGADLTPILKDILTWVKNAIWVVIGMGLLAIILKGRS